MINNYSEKERWLRKALRDGDISQDYFDKQIALCSNDPAESPARKKAATRWHINYIVIGALIAVMLTSFGIGGYNLIFSLQSKSWPHTTGVVRSSRTERSSPTDTKSSVHLRVEYTYEVNGRAYKGNRVQFAMFGTHSGTKARKLRSRYPKGARIQVFYNPRKPQMSVIEPGFRWTILLQIAFGCIFMFLGIVLPLWCKDSSAQQRE